MGFQVSSRGEDVGTDPPVLMVYHSTLLSQVLLNSLRTWLIAPEMTGSWMAVGSQAEMFGTVQDPQSQSLEENLFCSLLVGGGRKLSGTRTK